MTGAVTGGLFGWAGTVGGADSLGRYAAHALVGCAGGELSGSGCARGAASAVLGKYATNATDGSFIASTVAGGAISAVTGGSFSGGATTAAYGYLFNYCANGNCTSKIEQALYDFWPGYKFGTGIYNSFNGGSFELGEAVDGVLSFGGGIAGKGSGYAARGVVEAYSVANASKLAEQLTIQSARSPFTAAGTLTQDAINTSQVIRGLEAGS